MAEQTKKQCKRCHAPLTSDNGLWCGKCFYFLREKGLCLECGCKSVTKGRKFCQTCHDVLFPKKCLYCRESPAIKNNIYCAQCDAIPKCLWCGERPGHVTYHICARCRSEGVLACECCGNPHATGNTYCCQQCIDASSGIGPQVTPDLPESVAVHPVLQPVMGTEIETANPFPTVEQSVTIKTVKHNFYKKGSASYKNLP
jgi:hypothetical protein